MFDLKSQHINQMNIYEEPAPENHQPLVIKNQHSCRFIRYVCLQTSCNANRLICKQCAEKKHFRHRLGAVNKVVQPLSRLSMNSHHQEAQNDYRSLYSKITQIFTEWQKLKQIVINNMIELQNGIVFQLNTIINTFSSHQVDKAQEAMLNPQSKAEDINQFVNQINFLNKDYLQDSEKTIKYADFITNRTKCFITKAAKKVNEVLSKMQERIKEIDFANIEAKTEITEDNIVTKLNTQIQQERINSQKKLEGNSDSEEEKNKKASKKTTKNIKEEKQESSSSTARFTQGLGPHILGSNKYKKPTE